VPEIEGLAEINRHLKCRWTRNSTGLEGRAYRLCVTVLLAFVGVVVIDLAVDGAAALGVTTEAPF